jgi:hypothetical protein
MVTPTSESQAAIGLLTAFTATTSRKKQPSVCVEFPHPLDILWCLGKMTFV